MAESRVDKVDWRSRKERNRSKTLPRHPISWLPLQLGGDGEKFAADLNLPVGCRQHSDLPWGRLRHHLIRSGAEGGGGNDSAPLKAWDAGNF
jgi:hypothetical protein